MPGSLKPKCMKRTPSRWHAEMRARINLIGEILPRVQEIGEYQTQLIETIEYTSRRTRGSTSEVANSPNPDPSISGESLSERSHGQPEVVPEPEPAVPDIVVTSSSWDDSWLVGLPEGSSNLEDPVELENQLEHKDLIKLEDQVTPEDQVLLKQETEAEDEVMIVAEYFPDH